MEENTSTSESDVSDAACQLTLLDYSHTSDRTRAALYQPEAPAREWSGPDLSAGGAYQPDLSRALPRGTPARERNGADVRASGAWLTKARINSRIPRVRFGLVWPLAPFRAAIGEGSGGAFASRLCCWLVALLVCLACLVPAARAQDALKRVKDSGRLVYGSDEEGGGPYVYPDPKSPRDVTGFEVELMARLASGLGVKAVFSHAQWDKLLQVLASGRIDAVVNGYEWTEMRARDYLATRPYYVYELELLARRGGPLRSGLTSSGPNPRAVAGAWGCSSTRPPTLLPAATAGPPSTWSGSTARPTR